jgi:hypothetical protein
MLRRHPALYGGRAPAHAVAAGQRPTVSPIHATIKIEATIAATTCHFFTGATQPSRA